MEGYIKSLSSTVDDFRNFYKPDKQSVVVDLSDPIEKSLHIVQNSMQQDGINIIKQKSKYPMNI